MSLIQPRLVSLEKVSLNTEHWADGGLIRRKHLEIKAWSYTPITIQPLEPGRGD